MVENVFPIFIATRGRAETSPLIPLLISENIRFALVVEPNEVSAYAAAFPSQKLYVLPENNRGLPFARQFILQLARAQQLEWFWFLDDDIRQFYVVENKRCVPKPAAHVLNEAQTLAASVPNLAQAALEYNQFAWSATKPFVLNSYCDVAVLVNVPRCALANFRTDIKLKGDREFTLQLLCQGYNVIRCSKLAFAAPKNGSNKGGLAEIYATANEERTASETVAAMYGKEICEFRIKPDGRPDLKINWRYFRPKTA